MDKAFEKCKVVRDIEICKKCPYFHQVNDPDNGIDFHWGVGCYCGNHPWMAPWCAQTHFAVSEEEFVRATIVFARPPDCPQYKEELDARLHNDC